jgi:ribose transport system substrate-binding protein
VTQAFEAHPDLAGIVGMNGYHGPLLLKLFTEQDRLGKITLVTFDDEPETLAGVEAGNIYATVAQDPYLYGYKSVERLATVARHLDLMRPLVKAKSTFSINTQALRKDDVAEYRKQVNQRLKGSPGAKKAR